MIDNVILINSYNSVILFILIFIISIAIDLIIGELPLKIHPVVLIGKLINFFENYYISINNKLSGILLTLSVSFISIISTVILLFLTANLNICFFIIVSILLLSTTFSIKLLISSAKKIMIDLRNDLNKARKSMSFLVSRKTNELSEELIISATIETLSENITDSCISPFFYYFIFGMIFIIMTIFGLDLNRTLLNNIFANNLFYTIIIVSISGTIFYRIINTLDAMVGYKNDKYLQMGWFPAKLDDIFNYIPSRLSGFMVIISSFLLKMDWKNSYFIFKRDSRNCSSPNSGFTMASTAGALNIQLNKKNAYKIGDVNKDLEIEDINRAINLSKMTIIISTIFLLIIFILLMILINYLINFY